MKTTFWNKILPPIGRFFKRTLAVWIVAGVMLTAALGDFIYFKTFDLSLVSITGTDGTEDLYYSVPWEDSETVHFQVKLTRNGKPVEGHSIVAIGKKGGQAMRPRHKTDENGMVMIDFAPNPQFSSPAKVDGELFVYDEDNSVIIEFRLERYFDFVMVERGGA